MTCSDVKEICNNMRIVFVDKLSEETLKSCVSSPWELNDCLKYGADSAYQQFEGLFPSIDHAREIERVVVMRSIDKEYEKLISRILQNQEVNDVFDIYKNVTSLIFHIRVENQMK